MIYEHCSSLTFFPDELLYRLYHSNTFVLLLISIRYLLTCSKTKVSRLVVLFCCFISVLLKSMFSCINTRFLFVFLFFFFVWGGGGRGGGLYFTSSADSHKLSAILNIRHRTL